MLENTCPPEPERTAAGSVLRRDSRVHYPCSVFRIRSCRRPALQILYTLRVRLRDGTRMKSRSSSQKPPRKIGLAWLIESFQLSVAIPPVNLQASPETGTSLIVGNSAYQKPRCYLPNGWISHLRFALHYEPIRLDAYSALFRVLDKKELERWIRSRPASTAARRAWYLYELLMEEYLEIPDATTLAYVELLSSSIHVTGPRRKIKRQRIYNNLLGCVDFSPLVRKTTRLDELVSHNLAERANKAEQSGSPSVLAGAALSLFLKFSDATGVAARTRNPDETDRFIAVVMKSMGGIELTNKEGLIQLQNSIVRPQEAEKGWRRTEAPPSISPDGNKIPGLICASSKDLDSLMNGWMNLIRSIEEVNDVQAVVTAAVASGAFLLIRPFVRGNHRIHVVVLHYLLSILRFTFPGSLCSVSAATLRSHRECIEALTRVSAASYSARINVRDPANKTIAHSASFYRYFDATPFVEYVLESIDRLIDTDLPDAINFFKTFGPMFRSLPGTIRIQRAEMLVRSLLRHRGELSGAERAEYTDFPADSLLEMERFVREVLSSGYNPHFSGSPDVIPAARI